MHEWKPDISMTVRVPTYYGARKSIGKPADRRYRGDKKEFDEPNVPLCAFSSGDGLKVVLGSDEPDMNCKKQDVQIERRANGFAIFIHPEPGGDAAGVFYIHDDGRTWFVHDGPTPTTVIANKRPIEIDA